MASSSKKAFGELAVDKGLITRRQLYECLAEQEKLRESGARQLLSSIMHDKELLTLDQINELLAELEGSKRKEQIEGYQIISKLGKGGMGTVYLARQSKLNRLVAIKVLPPRLAHDKEYLARFKREAAATAELNHPNIVQALDFGESNNYHYFVMEYVEGDTVKTALAKTGVLEERRAIEITMRVASALEHAWKFLIVHRDIKPGNIMIDKDGVVKLCDLGLAIHAEGEDMSITRHGVIMGTPYYMSPEQARMEDLDIRSDIYSLGATLFHMVTGSVPFDGDGAGAVVTKHLTVDMPNPLERNPNLSAGICLILTRMMAKDKAERYKDPAELIADLEQLAERGMLEGRSFRSGEDKEAKRRRRRIVIAASATIAVGLLLLFHRQFPGGPTEKLEALAAWRDRVLGGLPSVDERAEAEKQRQLQREAAARQLYTQAEEYWRNHSDEYVYVLRLFGSVAARYPDTTAGGRAESRIALIRQRLDQEAKERLLDVKRLAEAAEAEGELGAALRAYEEFPALYESTSAAKLVARYREGLLGKIETRFEQDRLRAAELAERWEVAEAIALMERARGWGVPAIEEAAAAEIARLRERLADAPASAGSSATEEEARRLREVFGELSGLARAGELGEAARRLAGYLEDARYGALRETLDVLQADLLRARAAEAALVERLRARVGEQVALRVDGVVRRGTLEAVEKGAILIGGEVGTVRLALHRLDAEELLELAALDPDDAETPRTCGVLLALWGRPVESRRHLAKAKEAGLDVDLYLERVGTRSP